MYRKKFDPEMNKNNQEDDDISLKLAELTQIRLNYHLITGHDKYDKQ